MRSLVSSSPTIPRRRSAVLALVAVAALVVAGCGSDDGGDEATAGDATTEATDTSTTDGSTTTGASTETTTSGADDDTTSAPTTAGTGGTGGSGGTGGTGGLSPGDTCSLEEGDPDCIDPDGDGVGVYLIGGADCAATAPDISVCEDLDGDGRAGYPDEYEDLPVCSDQVPPPCNNPPGSSRDE